MITVRAMTETDLTQVVPLCEQLGYPVTHEALAERFPHFDASTAVGKSESLLVAADEKNTVLGWIHLHHSNSLLREPQTEICALVVDEKIRGQGVGKKLLAAAEEWSKIRGNSAIFLRTNIIRLNAHAFYKSQGYEHKKTWLKFLKEI